MLPLGFSAPCARRFSAVRSFKPPPGQSNLCGVACPEPRPRQIAAGSEEAASPSHPPGTAESPPTHLQALVDAHVRDPSARLRPLLRPRLGVARGGRPTSGPFSVCFSAWDRLLL